MKSLTVSVFYPAWCWIQDPTERFLYVSYAADVSDRDAGKMRNLVNSEWFRERWDLRLFGTKKVRLFENSKQGFRMSAAMGGQVTGKHGHQTWVDDPIKPADTIGGADATRTKLTAAKDFWRGTLYNRQAEPTRHVHGIMMQRLHDADLTGYALAEGGYEHLMIPMRYEPKRACVTVLGRADKRTHDGELLWPARFPEDVVKDLENQLGPFASAQMQQNPVPAIGGTFQREWFKTFWHTHPERVPGTVPLPEMRHLVTLQSWDLAFKGEESSDPVAGGVWGRAGAQYYLIDQAYGRMSYSETKDEIRRMSARYPTVITKLIEDKANGPAIINELGVEISGIEAVTPEGGKEARAHAVSGLFRAGNVILPHPSMQGYEWVKAYIEEFARFPRGSHDDQVDQTTQALLRLHVTVPKFYEAMQRVSAERKATEDAARARLAAAKKPLEAPRETAAPGAAERLLARLGMQS